MLGVVAARTTTGGESGPAACAVGAAGAAAPAVGAAAAGAGAGRLAAGAAGAQATSASATTSPIAFGGKLSRGGLQHRMLLLLFAPSASHVGEAARVTIPRGRPGPPLPRARSPRTP